jgi:hypothetical protein
MLTHGVASPVPPARASKRVRRLATNWIRAMDPGRRANRYYLFSAFSQPFPALALRGLRSAAERLAMKKVISSVVSTGSLSRGHSRKRFLFLFFRNCVLLCVSRLGTRGVSRSSRHAGWDAVDARCRSAFDVRTNDAARTAKSCGPDLPVLRSSLRCDERADDGGKRAGPRGDHV